MMCSSILRFICRRRGAAGIQKSGGRSDGRKMMSTTAAIANTSKISPWLMLPPTFDRSRGGLVYNFYSLADEEVLLFDKYGGGADPIELPDDDASVVGSSHGWLALMNRRNNDLYLSNPLSRRHIKLPPVDALPHPDFNLRCGGRRALVSKVTPPDEDGCRAMMSFGPGDRLAFCRPGCSSAWTPIGELFIEEDDGKNSYRYARVYEDFLYSKRRNLFNCLTISDVDDFSLEDWDLRVSDSPRINWIQTNKSQFLLELRANRYRCSDGATCRVRLGCCPVNLPLSNSCAPTGHFRIPGYRWLDDEKLGSCWILKHLVYAEEREELLLLFRFIRHATVCFAAAKVDKGMGRLVPSSLEGLAAFVGTNHSFVVEAAEFPHLKGNCIYFTDNKVCYTPRENEGTMEIKGGDIGIFDCGDGTLSSCYYPCLVPNDSSSKETIVPPPIWFTPTLA